MNDIMKRMPPREEGNSLAEIRDAFAWIGLETDGRRIDYDELNGSHFPLIAHFPDHFVVVTAVEGEFVTILDGYGRRRRLHAVDFKAQWDGKVLTIAPPQPGAFLPAYATQPASDVPRVRFRTLMMDAGVIENPDQQGDPIDFAFDFVNEGRAPLKIIKVRATCACAVSEKPQAAVAPGGSSRIRVKYSPGRDRGPFEETVLVETNDPVFPLLVLTLAGNTTQTLDVIPGQIDFGTVVTGNSASAKVVLRYRGDIPLRVTNIAAVAWLEAGLTSLTPALVREMSGLESSSVLREGTYTDGYVLETRINTRLLALGLTEGNVVIDTNLPNPRILIPCSVNVAPLAKTVPSIVFLGEVGRAADVRTKVMFSLRDPRPCRIVAFSSGIPGLTCEYPRDQLARIPLSFLYSAPAAPAGIESAVTVDFVIDGQMDVQHASIPVYAYAPTSSANAHDP